MNSSGSAVAQQPPAVLGQVVSTGLFRVPQGAGNVLTLRVFVSSFAQEGAQARVSVNSLVDGRLEPVLFRALEVPAGQARTVELDNLERGVIEVTVARTDNALEPSAAVTEFFPADAGVQVLVLKTPAAFVAV